MNNLDDISAITEQTGASALETLHGLPDQFSEGFESAMKLEFSNEYREAQNILICGMGGSHWPALIVQHLYKDELRVPLATNNNPVLPGWVNEKTLILLSSYSGTTDEPIACGKEALKRNHKLLTGFAHSAGIIDILQEANVPHYQFDAKLNPSGQPRNGYGYSIGAILGILVNLGLIKTDAEEIRSSFGMLEEVIVEFSLEREESENIAKQVAKQMHDKCPYIIVGEFMTGVGNAFQNQINETAKAIAVFREIPEINHHMMEGLSHPKWHHDNATFVFCVSPLYGPDYAKRFVITKEVIDKIGIPSIWIETKGTTKLDHTLYMLILGNWIALYLSYLYAENPNVIPYVDYFKKRMRE